MVTRPVRSRSSGGCGISRARLACRNRCRLRAAARRAFLDYASHFEVGTGGFQIVQVNPGGGKPASIHVDALNVDPTAAYNGGTYPADSNDEVIQSLIVKDSAGYVNGANPGDTSNVTQTKNGQTITANFNEANPTETSLRADGVNIAGLPVGDTRSRQHLALRHPQHKLRSHSGDDHRPFEQQHLRHGRSDGFDLRRRPVGQHGLQLGAAGLRRFPQRLERQPDRGRDGHAKRQPDPADARVMVWLSSPHVGELRPSGSPHSAFARLGARVD